MSRLTLEALPKKAAALVTARRKALADIAADKRYTADHKRALRDEAVKKYAADFTALQTEGESALAAARRATSKPAPKDAAAVLVSDRVWQRAKARLDSGTHILELVAEVAQDGDTETLQALRAEAPSYVLAHGGNRQMAQGVVELISRHLGVASDPNHEKHAADDAALARADYIAKIALGHVQEELSGGRSVSTLPLADGSVLTVTDAGE